MANIAPILWIKGRVRQVRERRVDAVDAQPAVVDDETGRVIRPAVERRAGYDVHDVTIDTDPGGLVTVVFREEAVGEAGGFLPGEGDEVEIPTRAYDAWQGRANRRYRVPGYSFAGKVYADAAKGRTSGARAATPIAS